MSQQLSVHVKLKDNPHEDSPTSDENDSSNKRFIAMKRISPGSETGPETKFADWLDDFNKRQGLASQSKEKSRPISNNLSHISHMTNSSEPDSLNSFPTETAVCYPAHSRWSVEPIRRVEIEIEQASTNSTVGYGTHDLQWRNNNVNGESMGNIEPFIIPPAYQYWYLKNRANIGNGTPMAPYKPTESSSLELEHGENKLNTLMNESSLSPTAYTKWVDEYNKANNVLSPPSTRSSLNSREESFSKAVVTPEFTCVSSSDTSPQGCWQNKYECNSNFASPVFQEGYNVSMAHSFNPIMSTQIRPNQMPNAAREKNMMKSISAESAFEKCNRLRRIRLQLPIDKPSSSPRLQKYNSRPNFAKNFRESSKSPSPHYDRRRSSLELQKEYDRHRPSLDSQYTSRRMSLESIKPTRLSYDGSVNRSSSVVGSTSNENLSYHSCYSDRSSEFHSAREYNSSFDESLNSSFVKLEPELQSYQLIGDSLLVRFGEQILHNTVKMIHGTRTIGLCVSGQKVMDLLHKVSMKEYPIGKKVVLLIGTNDILQNTSDTDMRATLRYLLNELITEAERIVLLTIPPIPKLQEQEDQWDRIENYNAYIKTIKDKQITIADIHKLYLAEPRKCIMECFEQYYGEGPREDLIHLNRLGLTKIYDYLTTNDFLT